MGTEGENGGYKYKAFFNGEWHDLTLSDSPDELTEWLQSNEEWTRVRHGHLPEVEHRLVSPWIELPYCPCCGAKMDEVEDGKAGEC